ncbi:MAG: formylglycine-generating enzyme family protein [Candidatus Omnitrophica bacterium]|nr:formylglycine-generating enzyme family protein [Candidatus Omnitrophota bacterium]
MKPLFGIALLFLSSAFLCSGGSAQIVIIIPTPTPTVIPTPTPDRDFNKDGQVNAKDLLDFIQGWHTGTAGDVVTVDIPNLQSDARPLKLVRIPAGTFQMGALSSERGVGFGEGPAHIVTVEKDFYLSVTEITQAQWEAITGKNIADQRDLADTSFQIYTVGKDVPIYYVSWNDAQDFISGLNALGQGTFRFPREAEWEYACRAGSNSRFFFGDSLNCDDNCADCAENLLATNTRADYMWHCFTDGINGYTRGPKEVGSLLPNPFGLYDMHGNVWEYCQDWYHPTYSGAPTDGSAWEDPVSTQRIYRGGHSFAHADICRSAFRSAIDPSTRHTYAGVRIAMDAPK